MKKKIGTEGVKERHYFSSLELQNGPLCREGFDSNLDFGYKNISFLRTLSFMNISLSKLWRACYSYHKPSSSSLWNATTQFLNLSQFILIFPIRFAFPIVPSKKRRFFLPFSFRSISNKVICILLHFRVRDFPPISVEAVNHFQLCRCSWGFFPLFPSLLWWNLIFQQEFHFDSFISGKKGMAVFVGARGFWGKTESFEIIEIQGSFFIQND